MTLLSNQYEVATCNMNLSFNARARLNIRRKGNKRISVSLSCSLSNRRHTVMASNPQRGGAGGSHYGGAAPYRSRDGLSTRNATGSEEIQLRIDPMHSDLDDEITGLHGQVRQLKNIAQEIGSEAKFQRDFLDELQMTLIRAQAGVKNNIRKLNLSIVRSGNNHIMHVVLFALLCFFILYMWTKMFKR